jgi:hypothetical protein
MLLSVNYSVGQRFVTGRLRSRNRPALLRLLPLSPSSPPRSSSRSNPWYSSTNPLVLSFKDRHGLYGRPAALFNLQGKGTQRKHAIVHHLVQVGKIFHMDHAHFSAHDMHQELSVVRVAGVDGLHPKVLHALFTKPLDGLWCKAREVCKEPRFAKGAFSVACVDQDGEPRTYLHTALDDCILQVIDRDPSFGRNM